MKKTIVLFFVLVLLIPGGRVFGAEIYPHERILLEEELSRCYSGATLAERVGICAVVLNRIDDRRYPDTVPGVIESLRASGEFCSPSGDMPAEKSARLTRDAVSMALLGADPTGGALNFRREAKKLRGFGYRGGAERETRLTLGECEFW